VRRYAYCGVAMNFSKSFFVAIYILSRGQARIFNAYNLYILTAALNEFIV